MLFQLGSVVNFDSTLNAYVWFKIYDKKIHNLCLIEITGWKFRNNNLMVCFSPDFLKLWNTRIHHNSWSESQKYLPSGPTFWLGIEVLRPQTLTILRGGNSHFPDKTWSKILKSENKYYSIPCISRAQSIDNNLLKCHAQVHRSWLRWLKSYGLNLANNFAKYHNFKQRNKTKFIE